MELLERPFLNGQFVVARGFVNFFQDASVDLLECGEGCRRSSLTWRPPDPEAAVWRLVEGTGWVDLSPALGWGDGEIAEALEDEDDDQVPAGRRRRLPWKHP